MCKRRIAFVIILISILLAVLSATFAIKAYKSKSAPDNAGQFSDRRPMVCVDGILYFDNGSVNSLPENAELIGTIEKVVAHSEQPSENLATNFEPLGCSVYADTDDNTNIYIHRPDIKDDLYLKYTNESGLFTKQ